MAGSDIRRVALCVLGIALIVSAVGCEQVAEEVAVPEARIALSVRNLQRLPSGDGHYTLWASFFTFAKTSPAGPADDEEVVSLGHFNIDTDGSPVAPDGSPVRFRIPDDRDPQLVRDIVVTIESEILFRSPHDVPGSPIMGGAMRGDERLGRAELAPEFDEALGVNFSSVEGQYALLAPSSPVRGDSNSGIWFVDISGTINAGLKNLPPLKKSWVYEGWVVDERSGTPSFYSTGIFRFADSADADGAGSGKGADSGLSFPGQDFITGPLVRPDLSMTGFWFMITLEPVPDNSPAPFSFTLLDSRRPALTAIARSPQHPFHFSTTAGVMYNQTPVSTPSGTLTIER
jgi:hypothetical protein